MSRLPCLVQQLRGALLAQQGFSGKNRVVRKAAVDSALLRCQGPNRQADRHGTLPVTACLLHSEDGCTTFRTVSPNMAAQLTSCAGRVTIAVRRPLPGCSAGRCSSRACAARCLHRQLVPAVAPVQRPGHPWCGCCEGGPWGPLFSIWRDGHHLWLLRLPCPLCGERAGQHRQPAGAALPLRRHGRSAPARHGGPGSGGHAAKFQVCNSLYWWGGLGARVTSAHGAPTPSPYGTLRVHTPPPPFFSVCTASGTTTLSAKPSPAPTSSSTWWAQRRRRGTTRWVGTSVTDVAW